MKLAYSTILIFALLFTNSRLYSQCEIPNGSFDDFKTITDTTYYLGVVQYDLPEGGWLENIQNFVPRLFRGEGFFGKYTGEDSNGNALLLTRSILDTGTQVNQNSGYIKFDIDCRPKKIKGRYKFSGSNLEGIEDDFLVGAFMGNVADSTDSLIVDNITIDWLVLQHISKNAKHFAYLSHPTDEFKEFEIDLSDYADKDVEFMVIYIYMVTGNEDITIPGYATGVLDDLHFVFDDDDENVAPVLVNPIEDITLESGFVFKEINISDVFYDADGDDLEYHVECSDTNVVKVSKSEGYIYISEVDSGSAVITLTANDGNGGSASDQFVVKIDKTNGIEDMASTNRILLFPNPVSDELTLRFSNEFIGSVNVEIFSEVSEIIGTYQFDKADFMFSQQIKVPELAAGLYIIKINIGNSNLFQKFIKL